MTKTAALLLAASLAAACSEKASVEADVVPSGPAAAVSGTPTAKPEKVIDRSPIAVKVDGDLVRLHVAAYRPFGDDRSLGAQASRGFRVHPFRDRMVVTQAGNVYLAQEGKLRLDPKAITTEPVPGETAPLGAYEIRRMEGSWPETLVVEAHFESFMGPRQFSSREVRYLRAGGKWKADKSLPSAVAAWSNDSLLALSPTGLEIVAGTPSGALPKLASATELSVCAGSATILQPDALATTPTGEVFVLGRRCDTQAYAVERFATGQTTGTLEDLPDAPKERGSMELVAGSATSVFAIVSTPTMAPYVARFDGDAFRLIKLPDPGRVDAAWAPPDGSLFLLTRSDQKNAASLLVRFRPDGTVTRFVAPQGRPLADLWAADAETAFTAWSNDYGNASILYSTKPEVLMGTPPPEVTEEGSPAASSSAAPPPEMASLPLPPWTEACTTPFVFLYDVSPKAPPRFDFPATRKAVATFDKASEVKLVEFVYEKKRKLGARVPSADVGRALMKHVVENMADEKPELVCYEPAEGLREIE